MEVPDNAAILLVPKRVASSVFGRFIKRAGSWINPPLPTSASMNPANKAKKDNDRRVMSGRLAKSSIT